MKAARRAASILVDPLTAWTRVEKEPRDVMFLFTGYVALLALIPAIAGIVGGCVIGVIVPGAGTARTPIVDGLLGAVFSYVTTFATVIVVGFLLRLLAPAFGARGDLTSAFKLAVYSFTPVWLAGVFELLPGLRFLELSGFYGAYLLAVGLPRLMKLPGPMSRACAATIVMFAGLLTLAAIMTRHALFDTAGV